MNKNIYLNQPANFAEMYMFKLYLCILIRLQNINPKIKIITNNSQFDDAIEELENKWVEIKAEYKNDWTVITFTDSGPGIPSDIAKAMLTPFYTTKEIGHGTGLGLSICVGIIKEHGGFFNYNKNASNTQFEIQFPKIKKGNTL